MEIKPTYIILVFGLIKNKTELGKPNLLTFGPTHYLRPIPKPKARNRKK